jgi:DNA polymerase III subunit alpha
MNPANFVHLHIHTEFSKLDSTITLKGLIDKAKQFGMPAVAITDHGNIDGAEVLVELCREVGIKPIVGCEMYIVEELSALPMDRAFHLLLLCENPKGYANLRRLVDFSHKEGFQHIPRIDKKVLRRHAEGLIALSACIKGEIPYLCLRAKYDEAVAVTQGYAEIFPGRFYLELNGNGLPEQQKANQGLLRIAEELALPVVATNDCHYLNRGDALEHEKMLCAQTGKSITDPTHMHFSADEFYLKSPDELTEAFAYAPQAIRNTLKIAERCEFLTV